MARPSPARVPTLLRVDDDPYARRLLHATFGADDYFIKPDAPRELAARVAALLSTGAP
jgi:DNA-binding response OmpR family regulator